MQIVYTQIRERLVYHKNYISIAGFRVGYVKKLKLNVIVIISVKYKRDHKQQFKSWSQYEF